MKILGLIAILASTLYLGSTLFACSDDDDDASDDDAGNDDDDVVDDDTDTVDDDTDDDLLGGGSEHPCLKPLSEELISCKTGCLKPDEAGLCASNHCLWGCYATMFQGAVDCAQDYPELEQYVPMWTCHRDCDLEMQNCLEPLDTCDNDRYLDCSDAMAACDAACAP